jgi:hypothetical protein
MIYCLLFLASLAVSSLPARADVISTFSLINVVFWGGATATGTLSIDTTTGAATALHVDVQATSPLSFSSVAVTSSANSNYYIYSSDSLGDWLDLVLPEPLIGYAGGNICSTDHPCAQGWVSSLAIPGNSTPVLRSGELNLLSSQVTGEAPEPSTLLLLGTGVAAAWWMTSRRRATHSAALS